MRNLSMSASVNLLPLGSTGASVQEALTTVFLIREPIETVHLFLWQVFIESSLCTRFSVYQDTQDTQGTCHYGVYVLFGGDSGKQIKLEVARYYEEKYKRNYAELSGL